MSLVERKEIEIKLDKTQLKSIISLIYYYMDNEIDFYRGLLMQISKNIDLEERGEAQLGYTKEEIDYMCSIDKEVCYWITGEVK